MSAWNENGAIMWQLAVKNFKRLIKN